MAAPNADPELVQGFTSEFYAGSPVTTFYDAEGTGFDQFAIESYPAVRFYDETGEPADAFAGFPLES